MTFREVLERVGGEALFETGLLLAGDVDKIDLQRQLARWTRAKKVVQLRRGLYALAAPYRKVTPHPFVVANLLTRPSYVSCEAALAFHGLIPEHVPVTTSVTSLRPGRRRTTFGDFLFRHVRRGLFWGYARTEVAPSQHAFVAVPEKALLDLAYLRPGADRRDFLAELRLDLPAFQLDGVRKMAARTGSKKLERVAAAVLELAHAQEADDPVTV